MIRIAICDDSSIDREKIKNSLITFSIQHNRECDLTEFGTSEELLNSTEKYDILLLDVMLENDVDGIGIGTLLRKKRNMSIIILITSRQDRYKEGYQANTFRYLTKPISQLELNAALLDAIDFLGATPAKFAVTFKGKSTYVNIRDILYVDSYYRKRHVHTIQDVYDTTVKWDDIVARLPKDRFMSPRKGYLINVAHVKESNMTQFTMTDGLTLRFTQNHYKEFNKLLTEHLARQYAEC